MLKVRLTVTLKEITETEIPQELFDQFHTEDADKRNKAYAAVACRELGAEKVEVLSASLEELPVEDSDAQE